MMGSRIVRGWPALGALVLAAGCGSSAGVEADPAVAPFVGTWDATVLTMTAESDPATVVDVLQYGEFFISIEPSGQYTATLVHPLGAAVEIGQLTVIGSTIRLDPSHPPTAGSATSDYTFTADDYIILDGPTVYDFNVDQVDDPALAHIELQRR